MTDRSTDVDVVIVGGGPTGLTAAHLCHQVGLSAVVLEQREGPQRSPAAHAVNARTFEIWRQAGVAMEPILDAALPPGEAGLVHWVTKLGGDVIGTLPYERQGDEMLAITPTPLRNLSQHRLEPLLLATELDVRYGHRWVGATETTSGVSAEAVGPDGPLHLDAKYLLGADGAASSVRRSLDIEMIGPRSLQSFVMVHLAADFRPLVGPEPGVLYFVVDPASGGTFVSHGRDREWVYMHPWDPEQQAIEALTPERCATLVRAAMADPDAPFEVLTVGTWHMSAQVAARFRGGRMFLVGDAAHRFPPTGGLGLNTGVADVHNLVWKLAGIESGWLDASRLDTYEAERKPVAQFNCEQSMRNAFKLIEVRWRSAPPPMWRSPPRRCTRPWPTLTAAPAWKRRSPTRRSTSTCWASNWGTPTTGRSWPTTAPRPSCWTNPPETTCRPPGRAAVYPTPGCPTGARRSTSSTSTCPPCWYVTAPDSPKTCARASSRPAPRGVGRGVRPRP